VAILLQLEFTSGQYSFPLKHLEPCGILPGFLSLLLFLPWLEFTPPTSPLFSLGNWSFLGLLFSFQFLSGLQQGSFSCLAFPFPFWVEKHFFHYRPQLVFLGNLGNLFLFLTSILIWISFGTFNSHWTHSNLIWHIRFWTLLTWNAHLAFKFPTFCFSLLGQSHLALFIWQSVGDATRLPSVGVELHTPIVLGFWQHKSNLSSHLLAAGYF
jgi:hypothetical protein